MAVDRAVLRGRLEQHSAHRRGEASVELAGEDGSAAVLTWREEKGNPILRGGKAEGRKNEINGEEKYLVWRPERSPDVGGFCRCRQGSSG